METRSTKIAMQEAKDSNNSFSFSKLHFHEIFLESANLNEIKKAHDLELLDGVITHPKFLVEEGINNREDHRSLQIDPVRCISATFVLISVAD